ncbi:hypothetical protein K0M31_014276 [Melipona bicolor]|uniref:Uncharacterized protein n=1 Tax=Melipona bicolor TaxID=60889 RepID=A0AA40G888_9HYME|nr:hypothetical protein K0M31_014276 [Melipona bicolor]
MNQVGREGGGGGGPKGQGEKERNISRVVLFGKFARCLATPPNSRIRFHGVAGNICDVYSRKLKSFAASKRTRDLSGNEEVGETESRASGDFVRPIGQDVVEISRAVSKTSA